MVKTKIVATIGPASGDKPMLRKMMFAGMDLARLNFSHGTHAEHLKRIELIRSLNKTHRRKIKILQDLEGYRIRIGDLKNSIVLKKKQILLLSNINGRLPREAVPFDYSGDVLDIKTGTDIFIDDGNICLVARGHRPGCVVTEVVVPGTLKKHKGINIPDMKLKFKGITAKDLRDIEFGIHNKVDYIAQSFVRDRNDILPLKKIVRKKLPACKIIAKIENRQGIDNIGEILSASDGVMVARGDMGVSIPVYEVPVVQKEIIRKCKKAGKIVITATQMLESMTENLRPTRAEVSDIANAVLDGTDMVMLSAETAAGRYPEESIKMMNSILKYTEAYLKSGGGRK
ncbi:MAG TPA: pyruvate kinase [Elusimicrobia bacterium]|nr:MAG: pyruvate kinase [Elusimicrobia bacterium RIFOXYA12_FULL_49_49]OGS09310.1 MAG: pyruvate kinase [Elusimicrobia bacterium RIFOXYA1_FULL_47_7]OGS14678.1 MAG: pyruvate kinase [Elusimicrobia bacterium RIFOXYA2_FULL_47_53]OGS25670.1 MAG: pyruvate kinase [Elusimicrobia bacterium RIFOXYB12_FULL_50_12]OGS31769.1 MAG: pyruvate kinase [Elusimicrobia bacterium RIFOXYB2_FULL_46_23]HBU69702.1 pyruvate kinase [Elusimicrobiota bacterium]